MLFNVFTMVSRFDDVSSLYISVFLHRLTNFVNKVLSPFTNEIVEGAIFNRALEDVSGVR